MDNEVEVFDSCGEGERKREDVGVSYESIMIAGSNKLKDFDVEDVFEEAMEPQERFQEQGDDVASWKGDDAAAVSALPSTLAVETPDDTQELDNFEEAIGVADGKHTEGEEVKIFANYEVENGEEMSISSVHSTECNDYVDDVTKDGKIVLDSEHQEAIGEIGGASCDLHEAAEERKVMHAAGSSPFFENSSVDEIPIVQANEGDFKVGGKDDAAAAGSALRSTLVIEASDAVQGPDNLEVAIGVTDESGKHMEGEKVKIAANYKVENGEEMSISTGHSAECNSYVNFETNGGKIVSDSEHKGATGEIGGASRDLHEAAEETKAIKAAGNSSYLENSSVDEIPIVQASEADFKVGGKDDDAAASSALCSTLVVETSDVVQEPDNFEEAIGVADESGKHTEREKIKIVANYEVENGEEMSISTGCSAECNSYVNVETNDGKIVSDSEHKAAIGEIGGASRDLREAAEETKAIQAAGNSSYLENSSVDEIPIVQASEADFKVGGSKHYQSKTSDEDNHGAHDNSSVVGEPEKIPDNNAKEKEKNQVNGELNSELASSFGKNVASVSSPARPAGLGRAAPLLEPAPRIVQQPRANATVSNMQSRQIEVSSNGEAEEYDETREKLQMIRVKFLRLAHRLGQTPHNVVVAQVLYRLGLAEQLRGRNGGRVGAFSFDRASAMAEQLEAAAQEPLDFSCTIMVLGKTGVGKSATINSIFDEVKFTVDAFHMGTKKVQDVVGTVQGIKVRVIDTPGLLPSWSDQRHNEKILHSVKRFIKKTPPDIVLYLDRLDMQSRDFCDMPLLRTITEIFGPSIWFNAIVVLTHAASAPPEGPNGTASSYDMFVTQRSHVVQQAIRQAAGDMRLMNPVSLVENHSACRINRAGQRVLPNGQVWKPHLLLLSFASKILAEANALLKLQDSPPGKPSIARGRVPPLPFLLSSLLQSRPQLKLPDEQFDDEDSLDDDMDESSDSDDEAELDDLPPFKHLTKAQVEKLSRAQKKAYFDELEYREKLFSKRQLKEERKQRKMMKKMAESANDQPGDNPQNVEEETGGTASVPVPMPDLTLPASFDSDNPTHRYRYLDSSNQWLVRPVLETHGWDHDVGYEGLNVERLFVLKDKVPLSFSGQVTKDKKDANVQMEIASSVRHGEGKATSLGFDVQTVGKNLAYTLHSDTRFSNFRRNKAIAGLSFTLLGDALSAGVKVEDKFVANKRFKLVVAGGAVVGCGDVAYGGSLEAQLRDKDYPLGRSLQTLGLSVVDWHGELAVGCNVQSQIPIGRCTNLVARANLNNRGAGNISIRLNSSEQLQIALVGLIPLFKKLVGYSQQLQFEQW